MRAVLFPTYFDSSLPLLTLTAASNRPVYTLPDSPLLDLSCWSTESPRMDIYVGGEGAGQQLFALPLLLLPQVPAVLEVPQGCLQVLHIVFQLVHSPAKDKQQKTTLLFLHEQRSIIN